jgi:hypothetical protein
MVFVADLFDEFILPFLNLPLFSKPKVAEFKRQTSTVIFIYKLIKKLE